MTEWKKYLLNLAEQSQMCQPFYAALVSCESKVDAIALYKKNATWAAQKDYPSLQFLRKEFTGFEKEGLFVDCKFMGEVFKRQQCYVLHHCSGRITIDLDMEHSNIPMLYIANGCNLIIERADSKDKSPISVPIYVFGSNKIVAEDTDRIHFRIYNKK